MSIEEVIDFLKSKKKLYSQMDESSRKDYVMECLDTAINLLSNMTDGDLISRDFMKKLGATCIAKRSEIGELVAISSIDNLPSAEKTARWISISERLPEEFQRVLVTIVNYKGDKVVRVAEYYNRKGKGVFQIKENNEQWKVGEKGLLAWTPLPEPYNAQREEWQVEVCG